jgi:hypothetical protein
MPRGSNPIKVQQWRQRLERFAQSGQTVTQFCQAERISEASFYQWKRKLAPQASTASPDSKSARPAFQAVAITSPSRSATTVRLAHGVEIELGGDLRVVGAVVKQLLEASSGATRAAGGRSC